MTWLDWLTMSMEPDWPKVNSTFSGGAWVRMSSSLVETKPGRSFSREMSAVDIINVANSAPRIFSDFSEFPASIHFFLTAVRLAASCAAWPPVSRRKTEA